VIAIPGESTIAYRQFIIDAFEKISPQGVPPFGSLLLAIIATNANGLQSIDAVKKILLQALGEYEHTVVTEAINFLNLLASLPQQYKEGKKRIFVLQVIFEDCHNILSQKVSAALYNNLLTIKNSTATVTAKKEFHHGKFHRDFRTISLLNTKFSNTNEIIEKIASLPAIPDDIDIADNNNSNEPVEISFIDALTENNKTFTVGSLVKRIWSGLNIPTHSTLPSQQPLGGVSDLTNKGDFDKLLISEFANDDISFMSRLANNEALYIHREIPPASNNLQRIILIDVSLKNWGTPKTIAFAVMLAIAKHPKTNIQCSAFVVGDTFHPVGIDSIDAIINGLLLLEGTAHCANGIAEFFKKHPAKDNEEIFLITESSAQKYPKMQWAMQEYKAINYWIYTDVEGNIDVYKKQQNSKKHIQHITLPLKDIWAARKKDTPIESKFTQSSYPLLLRNSVNNKGIFSTSDGEIFQVTGDKNLLRLYEKSVNFSSKGWDIAYSGLPFVNGEIEIGVLDNGNHIVLLFNPPNREITLLNISTGDKKIVTFKEWRPSSRVSFVFSNQQFFHKGIVDVWSISPDGKIEKTTLTDESIFSNRGNKLKALKIKYAQTQNTFKNINAVFINQVGNLVFNIHELLLNQGNHFKLDKTAFLKHEVVARWESDAFIFPDGSVIEVDKAGIIILKSSDISIPRIYMSSVLNASLGVATEDVFSGNNYYNRSLKNISTSEFNFKYIKRFIGQIQQNSIR